MEFGLLGPVMVRCDGIELPLRRGSQRALLAALLLKANRVVPADAIAEILWDCRPPPSAPAAIRNHVLRLRRTLGKAGSERVITCPRGYLIQVSAGELDVSQFEDLLGAARAAARSASWDQAAARADSALSLWRGEPLTDVESAALAQREIPRLGEMRLQALETRIEADLRLGRHADVISELQRLVGVHPLREPLHALLMLALSRAGREAQALAAYGHARRVLVDELGTEPGTRLRELHGRILAGDPALAAPEPAPAAADRAPAVPRQLPGTVRHFAGREYELAELTRILDHAEQAIGAVAVTVIAGTPGVGKTALAVRWAHQAAPRFPEGQLYVNLRGYDPGQPMAPSDALAGLLSALGVRGEDIPAGADERAARYRSLLAGRRMLVVLDNARAVEQVRPLLPGTETCMTVVTSRDSLAGLVARDGAARLGLDVLPLGDAVGLLRMLIGDRVSGEPAAAAELAAQCSRLPLTLRVAAELAAARPAAPLADLVSELSDRRRRLDRLDAGGDPRSSARTVFSWSCQHLEGSAALAFRIASMHPGPDMDRYALAALTATTAEQSDRTLKVLEQAHLIQETRPTRYTMHDLLRAYASELTSSRETEDQRRAAIIRLLDYYLHTAAAASDTLMPAERYRRPRLPPATAGPRPLSGPGASQEWLDAERANLVAIATHAATSGLPGHAAGLSATLARYLETGGHAPEALIIHGHARDAASRAGDAAAEAAALTSLATVDWRQGRLQRAAARLQHALALFGGASDRTGEARALANLGMINGQQGRYQQAASHLRHALAEFRRAGDQTGAARALTNLGMIDDQQGRYQQAAGHYQQALALFRQAGDRSGEAYALGNLGITCRRQGRYPQAASYFQQAMALHGETRSRSGRAQLFAAMGDLDLRQGRPDPASHHFQRALVLCRETGDRSGEATALNGLGEAVLCAGKPEHARAHHAAALDLAAQIGEKYQQARAHDGLASTRHAVGDRADARYHWQHALVIYENLGAPEADQVREKLAACPGAGHRNGPPCLGRPPPD
jgi:DNA-binding SARP family transcriptional activator/Tfp pilus assembly protein PilF